MVNINLLKSEIVKNGYTQKELCVKIGMTEQTFSRKLKTNTFNLSEANKIINVLNITNPVEVFFAN